jgi:hypothetical protein
LKWAKQKCWHSMERLGTKFHQVCEAASLAHSKAFWIVDIDLTIDVPGTLDAQPFADAVERAGNTLHQSSLCGLQCIKWTPSAYNSTVTDNPDEVPGNQNPKVTAKVYNKVIETMQQGKAKKRNLDDKFSKLLNPSTVGLQDIVVDVKYYQNGITRIEVTFPFNIGVTWTIKKMAKLLHEIRELLKEHLVGVSIHDHIAGMEQFVHASTFVYYPKIFPYKQRDYYAQGNTKQAKETISDSFPEGNVSHWYNSWTKKMNGVEIRGRIGTRDDHVDGWTPTALAIAACSNAGYDVLGFICVGGYEKWIDEPDDLQHRYYRMIVIERHGKGSQVQVPTGFIHKEGTLKNTCWNAIGVCAEELVLNPRIIEKKYFNAKHVDAANYVGIEISFPSNSSLAELQQINDCDSEAVEKFTGLPKRIRKPTQQNMPTEESRWSDIKWGINRGKDQLKFRFEGDWYWLPQKWHDNVLTYVFGKTDVECIFMWGSSSLVCEFNAVTEHTTEYTTDGAEGTTTEGVHMNFTPIDANPQTPPLHIGTISPMKKIPICDGIQNSTDGLVHVSTDGIEITSGGFKMKKGKIPSCYLSFRGMVERFWLPSSFAKRFWNTRSGNRNLDPTDYNLDYLAGCRLIKPDNIMIGVSTCPNAEYRMWIVSANGEVQAQQTESGPSLMKRGATSSIDSGRVVIIEASNKRRRIN